MKIGRNELCPCGSGKKYKKCCLEKEQDAAHAELARSNEEQIKTAIAEPVQEVSAIRQPVIVTPPPPPPPDPRLEAVYARWNEFEEATDETRWEIFAKTLDEPELMDEENAFEMLSVLFDSAAQSGTRDRFESAIEQLKARFPEVYAADRQYYLDWRILNALVTQRPERVPELAREMAETAGDSIDMYSKVVDILAYHGQLEALTDASRIAWPLIRTSRDILWGQNEFAHWGADCVLFNQLEQSRELSANDPELIDQIRFYYPKVELDGFANYVANLSGQSNRSWVLSDFEMTGKRRGEKKSSKKKSQTQERESQTSKPVDWRDALDDLLNEFIDYAHRQEGISYTKAALARENISEYLQQRKSGELDSKEESKHKPRKLVNVLCPDVESLDRFFASFLDFFNLEYYDVAATFELIPAWLRFLELRGLIESELREATLQELSTLQQTLFKLWERFHSDPALAENLKRWPETAKGPSTTFTAV